MDLSGSFDPHEFIESDGSALVSSDTFETSATAMDDLNMELGAYQESPPRSRMLDVPDIRRPDYRGQRSHSISSMSTVRSTPPSVQRPSCSRVDTVRNTGARPTAQTSVNRATVTFSRVLNQLQEKVEENTRLMNRLDQAITILDDQMTKLSKDVMGVNSQVNHLQDFVQAYQEDIDRMTQQTAGNTLSTNSEQVSPQPQGKQTQQRCLNVPRQGSNRGTDPQTWYNTAAQGT